MRKAGDIGQGQRWLCGAGHMAGQPEQRANRQHRQQQTAGLFADGGASVGPEAGVAGKDHAGDKAEYRHAHVRSGVTEDADGMV